MLYHSLYLDSLVVHIHFLCPLHAMSLRPFAPHVVACNAMIQDTHTHNVWVLWQPILFKCWGIKWPLQCWGIKWPFKGWGIKWPFKCFGNQVALQMFGESNGPSNVGESSGPSNIGESSDPSNVGESSGPSNVADQGLFFWTRWFAGTFGFGGFRGCLIIVLTT